MRKKKLLILFIGIASVTSILVIIGFMFNKTEEEKRNGLTEIFDVSPAGTIAYITYDEGQQRIILKNDSVEQLALDINEEKAILDIAFSPDGSSLVYSVGNKDVEEELLTSVNILDVESLEDQPLFQKSGLITDVAFDPKDEDNLFYVKANTYENYSPIARANPHDFDIYSFHLQEEKHTQYTYLDAYDLRSLQVSPSEDAVYIQMFDDANAETADDIFAAKSKVFKIPLDEPDQLTAISDPNKKEDIYDFALFSDEQTMIYQSISNMEEGGTFKYELYTYGLYSNEEKQLTHLKEYTSRPVISASGEEVYFIVDTQFAQKRPAYHLYKLYLNVNEVTEIELEYN